MTVTFVGASNAQGVNNHASVPAHQSGDILVAVAVNSQYLGPTPSIGSGWTLLATTLPGSGARFEVTIAYRTAVSSGTTNTGWLNFTYQTLAVYRGGNRVVNAPFSPDSSFTNNGVVGAGAFSRPGANTRAVFLTTWVNSGTINETISFPYNRLISTRSTSGGPSSSYYQFLGDEINESGNYNYLFSQQNSFRFAGAVVEFPDPTVHFAAETGIFAFQSTSAGFSLRRVASETLYAITGQGALFNLVLTAGTGQLTVSSGDALVSLQLRSIVGTFSVAASSAEFSANRLAQPGTYAWSGFNAAFRFNAPVATGVFAAGTQDAGLVVVKPDYDRLSAAAATLPARAYGGSEPTMPSFLRPYYVKHNSVSKSRDFGAVESLIADISGSIGSQAGTNTLFFKFELLNPADVRIQIQPSGSSTDHFLVIGLLDASRKAIQLDAEGFGFANDVHNTDADESIQKIPAGTYYVSLTSSQWQSIPYAIRISVIKFILLTGTATGSFLPSARLPLQKIAGFAAGGAQSAGTLRSPALIKKLSGAANGSAQPALTLVIPSGVAGGSMLPYGRLMMNWRLVGAAQGSSSANGTLTSEAPYGYGY